MISSYIKAIEYYLPDHAEANPPEDKVTNKVGIYEKRIAKEDELASDLAVKAAEKLFRTGAVKREEIDYLIYCTQSPDYPLPATACIIQDRLGLSTQCGAFDFNLGCSGYVYGLSIAKGLIESGSAQNVLLLTSDTYSKYVHPNDKSVRVLFGDGAAATLISGETSEQAAIGPFVFGTDGSGAGQLIVPAGGLKERYSAESLAEYEDEFGNVRSRSHLYMNGPEIFNFTIREIPLSIERFLSKTGETLNDYNHFVFHQANRFMLEQLRKKLNIPSDRFAMHLERCGNTVSSSIPITLKERASRIKAGEKIMLAGFGVGYSWAIGSVVWKGR